MIRTTVFDVTDRQRYERELLEARRESERLYEQVRTVATTLQQSLLAGDPPQDPRFDIATHYRPAVETLEVGGDWHDAFRLDDDTIAISVGDVAGRGIGAATQMGQLRSATRALALERHGPAHVLERLDVFASQLPGPRMATIAYAEVTPGVLTFACAGHPPPALLTGEDVRLLWNGRSPPIGAGGPRAEASIEFPAGAKVLLVTDGLIERRDRPLDEGLDLLVEELRQRGHLPPDALVAELSAQLLADERVRDDVCLLCLARA